MAISTIQPESNNKLKTILIYVLFSAGVALAVFFGGMLIKSLIELQGKTIVKVDTVGTQADVYINDKKVGATPLELKDVKPATSKIDIKGGANSYSTSLDLTPNSEVYLKRDLGTSGIFSSGQNIWVEKDKTGTVATIVSEPSDAAVYLENNKVGNTPYSSNSLSEDSYDVRIEYPGYEPQTARIKIQKGYTLNLVAKLFPMPVPASIAFMEGSTTLYNGILENTNITLDTKAWVDAVLYWTESRGLNIAGTGVTRNKFFDYFLDYQGNIYDKDGNQVSSKADYEKFKDAKNGLYLGRKADGEQLTQAAKDALLAFNQTALGNTVTIKPTPTGWLRVRDLPSLNGTEVAKVDIGAKYELLEEQTGWTKIKVSTTISGWVSSDYIIKN